MGLATHEIDKPLTFLPNGSVVLVLKETFQNSGQSAAVNVGSFADLVPLGPPEEWTTALNRQTQYCDKHRLWKGEANGLPGFTLFPKQERETTPSGKCAARLHRGQAANRARMAAEHEVNGDGNGRGPEAPTIQVQM